MNMFFPFMNTTTNTYTAPPTVAAEEATGAALVPCTLTVLEERRKKLHDSYQTMKKKDATGQLDGEFKTLFNDFVDHSAKHIGQIDASVKGIGAGKADLVFPIDILKKNAYDSARMGTRDSPDDFFKDHNVTLYGYVVVLDDTGKQKFQQDGNLIKPATIFTASGQTYAVFDDGVVEHTFRYGFRILALDGKDRADNVWVEAEVQTHNQKKMDGAGRILLTNASTMKNQQERFGKDQAGWTFERLNTNVDDVDEQVKANDQEKSTVCFTAMLQGVNRYEQSQETFDFICNYEKFVTKNRGPATRSTRSAAFGNLQATLPEPQTYKTMLFDDIAEEVRQSLILSVGSVEDETLCMDAVAEDNGVTKVSAKKTQEEPMVLKEIKANPKATDVEKRIMDNTFKVDMGENCDDTWFVIRVTLHEDKDDEEGEYVEKTEFNEDTNTVKFAVEEDLLIRVYVFAITDELTYKPIYMAIDPCTVGAFIEEPEEAVELENGKFLELPFPLEKKKGEQEDGWNIQFGENAEHVFRLRFFLPGVPAPVPVPPKKNPALVPAPSTDTLEEWMQNMQLERENVEVLIKAVQDYGFTSMNEIDGATDKEINDMMSTCKPLLKNRFKTKWLERQEEICKRRKKNP
jgi:hypothetical protein